LFKPHFRVEECLSEIRECLDLGWTGLGYKTLSMERAWCEYTKHAHAHFVNSSTSGLVVALETLKEVHGWSDDAQIITTPITFVSTNQSILLANLVPCFADTDNTLNLSPFDVERKINPKTKAVMFVGIGGNPDNYSEIRKLCDKYSIRLILDAAHMAGTTVDGITVGLDSDVAIYSFQAVKNLPTADSGMVCFKDSICDQIVRKRSWVGIDSDTYTRSNSDRAYKWYYEVEYRSGKYHGNSIMASLALVALRYLDHDNQVRRELAAIYNDHLVGATGITPIQHGLKTNGELVSSQHLYQIVVEPKNRDPIISHLNAAQIYPGVHYRSNLEYKIFEPYMALNDCQISTRQSASLISLPLSIGLTEDNIKRICTSLLSFFR
jgi:dTDP-4-amino-4,6-dideoxygalactose transaminase